MIWPFGNKADAVGRVAMVMAAGLGTRMRPLTNDRPKALVDVAGQTLLDHMLDRLNGAGVNEVVVNVHHFADAMRDHIAGRLAEYGPAPDITISDETDHLLETGGALVKARPLLGANPIFVANADPVWREDPGSVPALDALRAGWNGKHMDALLLLAPIDRTLGYDGAGDFMLDQDGRVTRRADARAAPYVYAGVQLFHPKLIDGFPEQKFSLNRMWDAALAAQRVFGVVLQGEWMHVGDPAARDAAQLRLASLAAQEV